MEAKGRFFILRTIKYGEADLIVHGLSPAGEKCFFIARSALKSKKRFGGGVLEPSHFVQFTYKEASATQGGHLHTLAEATLLNDFKKIRRDYDHLEMALYFVECVARVSQEGDRNSGGLFNLLGNSLSALEGEGELDLLKLLFHLKFLSQQGVLTVEAWMELFLGLNIADVVSLGGNRDAKKIAQIHLPATELAVQQYIKTAERS